jgi:ferredoxin
MSEIMPGIPSIDLSECTRCDSCVEICPEAFRYNEAGYIEVIERAHYPGECVEEAMKYCPAACISWVGSEGADES